MQLGSCRPLCASTHHHVRESGKRGRTRRTLAVAAISNANRPPSALSRVWRKDNEQYDKGSLASCCKLMLFTHISVLNRRVWWRGDQQFYKGRITSYKTG